jgi:uncharacterized membrane protein YccC
VERVSGGGRAASFWRLVTRYDAQKIAPWIALRNTIGIALPLAAAAAWDATAAGTVIATGALNVAFSDRSDPYRKRARRMLATSALVGLSVMVAGLCAADASLAVAAATAWAFAAGILVAVGATPSDLGVTTLVTFLVFSAQPRTPAQAAVSGLLALAGGVVQTGLSLVLWPMRRREPERRALADLYLELSRAAGSAAPATEPPPVSAQASHAYEALFLAGRDHSIEGERSRSLLSQAERIRLSLLILSRLRVRLEREAPAHVAIGHLERYLALCSPALSAIAAAVRAQAPPPGRHTLARRLERIAEELRAAVAGSGPASALLHDLRTQIDALNGQLRSAADLAANAAPAAFERREAARPVHLRLAGARNILRANLNLRSAAFRHALRLAICVAVAGGAGRALGFSRPYWIPMTVAIVLKPDFTATVSRGILRLAGTFLGLLLATATVEILPDTLWMHIALVAASAFAMRCFGPANYGILVTAVTALVVQLFALAGAAPRPLIPARGWDTMAGGVLALLAYALWPTWERTQAPEALARMLDAYRDYFRAIREAYLVAREPSGARLDRARDTARLARSNLQASVDRLVAEPGAEAEDAARAAGILASTHRLAHAMMALEAGLAQSRPVPARAAFEQFADQVELTLYYLAAALRGSVLKREDLPDLREAHHALTHAPHPAAERYDLVNTETDRITNSLNTLAGEILVWLLSEPG